MHSGSQHTKFGKIHCWDFFFSFFKYKAFLCNTNTEYYKKYCITSYGSNSKQYKQEGHKHPYLFIYSKQSELSAALHLSAVTAVLCICEIFPRRARRPTSRKKRGLSGMVVRAEMAATEGKAHTNTKTRQLWNW